MKVRVSKENIERNGDQITVTLQADLFNNDPREALLFEKILIAVGRSKCSPDDIFDERLGVRLAKCRAYKDLYEQVYCIYQTTYENLKSRFRVSETCMRKYLRALEKQRVFIDELIDKSRPKKVTNSISEISVRILPGSNAQIDYSRGIQKLIKKAGISCEIISEGSLFSRLNKSDNENIPFTLIINEYEESNGVVSVRTLGGFEGVPSMPVELFIETYIKK